MIRVLVTGLSTNYGGTESAVEQIVHLLHQDIIFEFLTYGPLPQGHFDGYKTFIIPPKRVNPIKYKIALKDFFRKEGCRYDAIWMNLNSLSNLDSLRYAKKYGIKKRILHAHNDGWLCPWPHKILSEIHKGFFLGDATDLWACSKSAGRFFYGKNNYTVIPNLINFKKMSFSAEKRFVIRQNHSLNNSFVIGTVGRCTVQKNQQFILELMPSILLKQSNAVYVVVGDGNELPELKKIAKRLYIEDHVRFVGAQEDIQGYLSSFDVFVFPSIFEGLGISLLEAQANNLSCIVSDRIDDIALISNSVVKVDLGNKEQWIEMICHSKRSAHNHLDQRSIFFDSDIQNNMLKDLFVKGTYHG